MKTAEIINYLYTQYYLKDSTPERLVSSYWKYFQNLQEVRIKDGRVESLVGISIGDLQSNSIIGKFFSWLTIGSYLWKQPDKKEIFNLMKPSLRVTKRMGLSFTYDAYRQMCSLVLIRRHLKERKRLNVIIIGDGYGFLGSLIKEIYPDSSIVLVDLGKVLLGQAYYCGKAHPGRSHCIVDGSQNLSKNELQCDFIYCPTEHLKMVDSLSFDLAINIASMQEMNQGTIEEYFNYLRQHMTSQNLFYCCNRERKKLSGGEVVEFLRYPWSENDTHLVDEYCPWYRYFLSVHKVKNGPKLLNFRISFVHYFEGVVRHRLTIIDVKKGDKGNTNYSRKIHA